MLSRRSKTSLGRPLKGHALRLGPPIEVRRFAPHPHLHRDPQLEGQTQQSRPLQWPRQDGSNQQQPEPRFQEILSVPLQALVPKVPRDPRPSLRRGCRINLPSMGRDKHRRLPWGAEVPYLRRGARRHG